MIRHALKNMLCVVPEMRRLFDTRDAAICERDQARQERDAKSRERDQALSERDSAIHERDQAIKERDRFEILPGNDYARYALPIEYPPSRDLRARWGASQPPIPSLATWFAEHASIYRAFFEEMIATAPDLAKIPRQFSEANLPLPAWFGIPFNPFDSLALYTMVKTRRPRRYLEIGSGSTTCFAYQAIRDHRLGTKITSIDPEPRAAIDAICDQVIRNGLETCDLAIFDELEPNDILFFDGSHRSFMNSDVTVFMIDVLPRLKPGVIVHVHDISLPYDYHDLFAHWYWNEQYLLAVYLMNARHRIEPLLPVTFTFVDPQFKDLQARLPTDFGVSNAEWLTGGGSMWFTHNS
jgi:predicted O-methyltransferase YrrM